MARPPRQVGTPGSPPGTLGPGLCRCEAWGLPSRQPAPWTSGRAASPGPSVPVPTVTPAPEVGVRVPVRDVGAVHALLPPPSLSGVPTASEPSWGRSRRPAWRRPSDGLMSEAVQGVGGAAREARGGW